MNLVIWLVVGGVMGCVASFVARTAPPRIVMNMVVGIMGALVGGWLVSPLFGGSTMDQVDFSGVALIVSVAGALMFLAISRLAQREIAR